MPRWWYVCGIRLPLSPALSKKDGNLTSRNFARQPELIEKWFPEYKEEVISFSQKYIPLIDQGILLWNIIYSTVRKYQERFPTWIFVRHEDLSREPVEGFLNLYQQLGLPFNQKIERELNTYTKSKVVTEYRRNSLENITSWKERLSPEEIQYIKDGTREVAPFFYSEEEW